MKQFIVSALAVAAFGATVVGTTTASAAVGWQVSGWQYVPGVYHFQNSEGFAADYNVNLTWANETVSRNTTGDIYIQGSTCNSSQYGSFECPTTHVALTECNDGSVLAGNYVYAYVANANDPTTYSGTQITNGFGSAYYYANGTQAPTDPGICPSNHPIIAGGVFIWNY